MTSLGALLHSPYLAERVLDQLDNADLRSLCLTDRTCSSAVASYRLKREYHGPYDARWLVVTTSVRASTPVRAMEIWGQLNRLRIPVLANPFLGPALLRLYHDFLVSTLDVPVQNHFAQRLASRPECPPRELWTMLSDADYISLLDKFRLLEENNFDIRVWARAAIIHPWRPKSVRERTPHGLPLCLWMLVEMLRVPVNTKSECERRYIREVMSNYYDGVWHSRYEQALSAYKALELDAVDFKHPASMFVLEAVLYRLINARMFSLAESLGAYHPHAAPGQSVYMNDGYSEPSFDPSHAAAYASFWSRYEAGHTPDLHTCIQMRAKL